MSLNNIFWCSLVFPQEVLAYVSSRAGKKVTLDNVHGIRDTLFCEVLVFFLLFRIDLFVYRLIVVSSECKRKIIDCRLQAKADLGTTEVDYI